MNKELTPLEALKEIRDTRVNVSAYGFYDYDMYGDELDIIETALKDFEWLKHKLNLTFLNSLRSPEDKMRVMKIMGVEYDETYTK